MDDEYEEPDLPQILTPEVLRVWNKRRSQPGCPHNESTLTTDTKSFLMSEQHLLALDPQIKRNRQLKVKTPELWPDINPNLPTHLQELQIFHRDDLKQAETNEQNTLPNIDVLKQEVMIEAGMKKKAWKYGLELTADHKPAHQELQPAMDEKGRKLIKDILEQWTR